MHKTPTTNSKRIPVYYKKTKERSPPKARNERSPVKVLKDVTNAIGNQGQVTLQGASKADQDLNWKSKIAESTSQTEELSWKAINSHSFNSNEDPTSDDYIEATKVSSKTPSTSHSSPEGASEDTLQASNKTENEADANNNCISAGNYRKKGTSQSSPLWNRDDFKGPRELEVRTSKSQETLSTDTDHTLTGIKKDIVLVNIERKDLVLKSKIGEGSFGVVYKGLWKGGIEVAVKETPRRICEPNFKELDMCRRLRHPNVIQLIGFIITDTDLLMVMNFVKGCNLGVALGLKEPTTNDSAKILDEKYNAHVLNTAAQGLAYIHEKGLIHQNFKPTNIMIEDRTNNAIICDLGLAVSEKVQISNGTIEGPNAGTPAYQHQEQILGKTPTTSVDVYSFGVLTLVVFTRMPAWGNLSTSDITARIMEGEYPVIPEKKCLRRHKL